MEFTYSLEDFETTSPYEEIASIKDPFRRDVVTESLSKYAVSVGFKSFRKRLRNYNESVKQLKAALFVPESNIIDFEHSTLELSCGEWTADDSGIYRWGTSGIKEYACTHPIYPVERLRNIDTNELKVKLAFRRGDIGRRMWSTVTEDFETVANAKNVVSLAKIGVSVTSGKRAQNLVDYLTEVMDRNYDIIPERKSVSRLGWNEEGFSPYIGDLEFDGNDAFGRTFAAIRPHGSFAKWIEEAKRIRAFSISARILIAASFASVLVEPMGCLPFFVHLWGMASETGKTVGQMVAASVWGEPSPGGEYFKTFKSTTVGFEVLAGFMRSLPLIIDELQLAKDARGKILFNVYELAAGTGKLRSNTKLGVSSTPRWANCFITSGETPITNEQDGAGALNRVIEVECIAENKVIENGHRTAEIVKLNYGHAGKAFIEALHKPRVLDEAKKRYSELYELFTRAKAADKQSHSAALIVLADELATDWIFQDNNQLTVESVTGFLKSKEAISAAERGYEYMCDWVAQNASKLKGKADVGDVYGLIPDHGSDYGYAYIIRAVFNKACSDAGISAPALLSHLRSSGLLKVRDKGFTKTKRINDIATDCVIMKLKEEDLFYELENDEELPF